MGGCTSSSQIEGPLPYSVMHRGLVGQDVSAASILKVSLYLAVASSSKHGTPVAMAVADLTKSSLFIAHGAIMSSSFRNNSWITRLARAWCLSSLYIG